jgi:hypothetical protein
MDKVKRTRSNRVSLEIGDNADAGTILAALKEMVAPHPKNEEYLYSWSRRDYDKAPACARFSLVKGLLTIEWTDEDEEAHDAAHTAEVERRDAEDRRRKAEKEAAEAASLVPAPEGSRVLVVDETDS